MGTRGTWGFVLDGEEKLTYNHFDSYPGGLGSTIVQWLRDGMDEDSIAAVRALRLVDEQEKPTAEEQKRLVAAGTFNENVSSGRTDEWYALLRNCQGDPEATLASGFMCDGGAEFALDSLFCEWAYVIDLDAPEGGVLEVYQGFQHEAHEDGRFAKRVEKPREGAMGDKYYPVRLIATYPLHDLPEPGAFEERVHKITDPEGEDE